jgi:SSS family solute:Na+ symporter
MPEFGLLNWTILVAFLLLNLALGFETRKSVSTAEDFFVGRRTTPWWAIGISVVATYVSALTFLGGPAWSYENSLAVIAIHLNYPIVIVLVITLFLPFFYNSGVASIYEYMERRFGVASRVVIASIFLVSQALTSAAILYATALVIEFITGLEIRLAILVVTGVALTYTILGGTKALIWTDVFQAAVMFVGALIILFALIDRMPLPVLDMLSNLESLGKTNALDFSFDLGVEATVWSGVIAMSLFHVTVYGANQMMVQRTLAARSIGDAKKSYLMMGFGAFFIYFLFFLLGILLYGYYGGRQFANGNTIILAFAAEIGMPGLMGIIAAAIFAASMSSLAAAFNSLATSSIIDFYQRFFRKQESPQHYLKATRLFTALWAVAIIVPAIIYARTTGSVLQTLSEIGSYFVGAKLSMYGLGFFSRQATEKGLLTGVALGFLAVWYVASSTDIAWPWFCLIGASVTTVTALIASRLIDGPQQTWSDYSIKGQQRRFADQGLPLKDGRWHRVPGRIDGVCYVLLGFFVLTLAFLWAFERII